MLSKFYLNFSARVRERKREPLMLTKQTEANSVESKIKREREKEINEASFYSFTR